VEFCHALKWQLLEAGSEVLWQDSASRGRNVLVSAVAQLVDDVRSEADLPWKLKSAVEAVATALPSVQLDEEDSPMVVDESEL
jgi:hypothetical protein